ncbi:MAG: FAD-dependent oxidoreductase [Chthoniobacter sp.]|nr:FAD-dependent oxidoreductase [Chthoniobacter sp.]
MSKHVVILGAGVIGLSAAFACARAGCRVTIIERQPEQRGGCSFGNAGMVVPSHFVPLAAPGMVALGLKWMWNPESPFYIQPRLSWDLLAWAAKFWRAATPQRVAAAAPVLRDLSLLSRACFVEQAGSGLNFGLVQKGLLMLCKTAHTLDEEGRTAAQANALGMPAQVLDARATAALDPGVTMSIAGSVYFPKDCHLPPERYLAVLQSELTRLGADFRWSTEVTGWRTAGSRIAAAETRHGEIAGDEFVICGGAWSPSVARGLGLRLPMQAGKGYSLTLRQPRQLPSLCAIFTEARIAVTPMDGALRVGGTMEIAGLNETINARRVRGIIRSVPDYYPEFREEDFADIKPWAGLRPCSPDGLPYLGRTARWPNLICATGHAMMGLSLAPATGHIVEELVSHRAPSVPLTLLSPDRY